MIRNETAYQEASKRLGDELQRLDEHRARLKEAGLGGAEAKLVIDPLVDAFVRARIVVLTPVGISISSAG
jgi:hypothetical protein